MMKTLQSSLILSLLILIVGCSEPYKGEKKLAFLIENGDFSVANRLIEAKLGSDRLSDNERYNLLYLQDLMKRIQREFSLTEADVIERLTPYFSDSTRVLMPGWETNKSLEFRLIDGEKRYFRNAVPNLFRLDDFAKKIKIARDGAIVDPLVDFCLKHTEELVNQSTGHGELIHPVDYEITYTIRVKADAVPAGEIIRCWMPFPKESSPRQTNIELINVFPNDYKIAPDSFLQRSIYCEQVAQQGTETEFSLSFAMRTYGQVYFPDRIAFDEYDVNSQLYIENTRERFPQIVFSERIRNLADQICGDETNPLKQVEMLYNWVNNKITWASALEYSIMPNIPEYVLENNHGDCGMQTLLFMTMARYRGIPVKWQSGWMLHPGEVNLHDWCEVYYQGVGWVPLDQSFGLQNSEYEKVKNFYRTGIDPYRLIVNDDFSREFFPAKIWPRSEPIDFQRGELEWKGGNIYFDKWTYKMEVSYNPE